MDPLDTLPIRFHYGGEFLRRGNNMYYLGEQVDVSYIDRDKVSLPEIMGHLKDHCTVEEGALLHWLVPRRQLSNGLRVLMDDQACIEMANNTKEGDVAEIYVEGHAVDDEEEEDDEDSNFEDEIEGEQEEHDDSEFEGGYEELTDPGEDVLVAHNKHESREDVEKQIKFIREWYSPSKMDKGK